MGQRRLLTELEDFVERHRAHGVLHANAGTRAVNGYRLFVRCPCGLRFERWVVAEDAAVDVTLLARWN